MSIQKQRNSLISSSNSINSIRDSVSNFSKGLGRTSSIASGIIDQTRKTNIFTSRLIRKDDEYFNKRRENVRRKQREDELESTSIRGVEKKQGNIVQRSTKGFLGRILDFFGIILIGWFINSLPVILNAISSLIKRIKQLTNLLSNFVEGVGNFFTSMGQGIKEAMDSLPKFDFLKAKTEQEEASEKATDALTLLNTEFIDSVTAFEKSVDDEVLQRDVNKNNLEMTYGEDVDKAYKDGIQKAKEEGTIEGETEGIGDVGDATLDPDIGDDNIRAVLNVESENENVVETPIENQEGNEEDEKILSELNKIGDKSVELVNNQKEKDASSEKDVDTEIKNQTNKLKTTIGDVSKRDIKRNENNKKIVSPLLAKRFREKTAKKPITVNGFTYNPGDEGYNDAINMISGVASESGAIIPITKDEQNLVKNKKSNKTTVIIKEVAVNTDNGGSSGGGGGSGIEVEFNTNKDPIKKAQTLILNS